MMNRPYYDQVGFEPHYETSGVLEGVLDDRELDELGKEVLER